MSLERRHIRLEGGSNVRDIGGYTGDGGRTVRWAHVYRSGAISKLTPADWAWVGGQGIAAVCDLRAREERELAPTRWAATAKPRQADHAYDADLLFGGRIGGSAGVNEIEAPVYLLFARLLAPSFRLLFKALLDGHVPVLVHCAAGQDRTGLAIGLLLEALGVSREEILEDYHLSTQLRRIENEIDREMMVRLANSNPAARYFVEAMRRRGGEAFKPRQLFNADGESLLSAAFAAIEREWGAVPAYLEQELGMGPAETRRLRTLLLEDPPSALHP